MIAAVSEDARGGTWAMPGSAAEQQDAAPVVPGAAAGGAATGVPAGSTAAPAGSGEHAAAVPRMVLRPMTVADVLDGAFAVIKARPRKILTFVAAFVVPVQLLAAYAQRNVDSGFAFWVGDSPTLNSDSSVDGNPVWTLVFTVLPMLSLVCVAAGLSHLVSGWSVGYDASGREMLGVVGRRWWPLLASFVLGHLAEVGGLLACCVGVLFVMPLVAVVAPVIGTEQASAIEALSRSVRLARARYWPTFGLVLLMAVVSVLLGIALSSLPQGLGMAIGLEYGWPLYALGGIFGALVTTPFIAAATVLLYLDLRVRTEGLDLDIAARTVLDRAA
jgi:hypothetical protein